MRRAYPNTWCRWPPPSYASLSAPGYGAWRGGCTCSASADISSPSSRGDSTTLGELRAARATYRAEQHDQPDEESSVVLSVWEYIGSGYLNPGDAMLAAGVEASLRVAREALLELRRGPP
jgi:hypothetical protein